MEHYCVTWHNFWFLFWPKSKTIIYIFGKNTGNEIHSLINMYYKYVFMQIFKYNSNVICTDWEINHPPIFIRSFIYLFFLLVCVCLFMLAHLTTFPLSVTGFIFLICRYWNSFLMFSSSLSRVVPPADARGSFCCCCSIPVLFWLVSPCFLL